jgi:hypothetical protein
MRVERCPLALPLHATQPLVLPTPRQRAPNTPAHRKQPVLSSSNSSFSLTRVCFRVMVPAVLPVRLQRVSFWFWASRAKASACSGRGGGAVAKEGGGKTCPAAMWSLGQGGPTHLLGPCLRVVRCPDRLDQGPVRHAQGAARDAAGLGGRCSATGPPRASIGQGCVLPRMSVGHHGPAVGDGLISLPPPLWVEVLLLGGGRLGEVDRVEAVHMAASRGFPRVHDALEDVGLPIQQRRPDTGPRKAGTWGA